jgi:hypothetical protein
MVNIHHSSMEIFATKGNKKAEPKPCFSGLLLVVAV